MRALRLYPKLLDVAATNSPSAWAALEHELLERTAPLLLFVDPKTRSALLRTWPEGVQAIAAYPDRISLEWAVADTRMAAGSFSIASMPPRALFAWAQTCGVGVAINVYRGRESPLYLPLELERLRALVPPCG